MRKKPGLDRLTVVHDPECDTLFRGLGLGLQIPGLGFRGLGLGLQIPGLGFRALGLGLQIPG